MYTINTVKDKLAHYEGYKDDAIICFASAHTEFVKKTIDWFVPECIKNDFAAFIKDEPQEDKTDKIIWEKYEKWFIKKLCLKDNSINIGTSRRYFTRDIDYAINDDNIKYNKKNDKIENIKSNKFLTEFAYNNFYEKNNTAAYIANNQIMAMISVKEDGAIMNNFANIPVYDKIEYAIPCLKKLANEFKIVNRKIYIDVYDFEADMKELVKQMEMEWLGNNYHFSFDIECKNVDTMLKKINGKQ
ncbi:hypothetical protein AGMMS50293_00010 [Spirochaetia bacterium]|nr:hypothetical protein AGMMS50293_00010 [Spirochaetia bacterium]